MLGVHSGSSRRGDRERGADCLETVPTFMKDMIVKSSKLSKLQAEQIRNSHEDSV